MYYFQSLFCNNIAVHRIFGKQTNKQTTGAVNPLSVFTMAVSDDTDGSNWARKKPRTSGNTNYVKLTDKLMTGPQVGNAERCSVHSLFDVFIIPTMRE